MGGPVTPPASHSPVGPPYRVDRISRGGYYGIEGPNGREPIDCGSISFGEEICDRLNAAYASGAASREPEVGRWRAALRYAACKWNSNDPDWYINDALNGVDPVTPKRGEGEK